MTEEKKPSAEAKALAKELADVGNKIKAHDRKRAELVERRNALLERLVHGHGFTLTSVGLLAQMTRANVSLILSGGRSKAGSAVGRGR